MPQEAAIRLGFFLGALGMMAAWEVLAPRRRLTERKAVRWANNLAVTFLNTALVRVIFPLGAVGAAAASAARGFGLFNRVDAPAAFEVAASVVLLDLLIYAQHVAFHRYLPLWRLHRMHHADLDIDVTTGSRFHPVEIALSMLLKIAAVALLGAPPMAVLVFEVVLNAMSMFNHANALLPLGLDAALRLLVVTPDMHRVHHSVLIRETNSNYGFNLSVWDRAFGTYRPQPERGHEGMRIGLANFRDQRALGLRGMLLIPLAGYER